MKKKMFIAMVLAALIGMMLPMCKAQDTALILNHEPWIKLYGIDFANITDSGEIEEIGISINPETGQIYIDGDTLQAIQIVMCTYLDGQDELYAENQRKQTLINRLIRYLNSIPVLFTDEWPELRAALIANGYSISKK